MSAWVEWSATTLMTLTVLAALAVLGLRRGWVREVATLGGLLGAWLILTVAGPVLVDGANRLALMFAFTWFGGFDDYDPAGLLNALRAMPAIDAWHAEWFYMVLFVVAVVAAYLASGRIAQPARATSDSLLGALAGGLNGYLASYVLFERLSAGRTALGQAGLVDAPPLLGGHLTTVVVVGVVSAVALALVGAQRRPALKSRRAARGG